MKKFKRSTPLIEIYPPTKLPHFILIYCWDNALTHEQFANKVNIKTSTFSNKLKYNNFSVNEQITITEEIRGLR